MPNAHARPLPHTAGTRVCTRWSSKLYCILNLSKAKYNEKCGYLWMCIYFGWSRYSESARYLSHKRTHLASMTQYQMNLHLYTCVFWVARSRTRLFLSSRFLLFFYDCMLYVCRLMISSSTQPYECIWCRPPFWIADDKQRKMNAKKAITHTHTLKIVLFLICDKILWAWKMNSSRTGECFWSTLGPSNVHYICLLHSRIRVP